MQKILVTGGAGFIGSHTVDQLLQQGKEVIVLDNLSFGKIENLPLEHKHLTLIEGDILEYPLVKKLVGECDAVLHLAAITSVPFSVKEPIYTLQVNTQGSLHVLQAIAETDPNKRLVYASSSSVYGNAKPPCDDKMPLDAKPLSPYALQKIHTENYADLYAREHQLKSLGLRYFNVYGLRQDPTSPYSGVISLFLNAIQKEKSLVVYGDGEQTRDFVHVSDIANANVKALESNVEGVMNLATGKGITLLQLIYCFAKILNKKIPFEFAPYRLGDIKHSYANIEKAKTELGFQCHFELFEGLKQIVEFSYANFRSEVSLQAS